MSRKKGSIAWNKGLKPWWIGHNIPHTQEAKNKMSISHKGHPSSRKGQPLSEETKRKLSESLKGRNVWNKGQTLNYIGHNTPHREESKLKQSETMKKLYSSGKFISPRLGIKHSEEQKIKQSNSLKKSYAEGKFIHPMLGKHHTEETKIKLRKTRLNHVIPTKDTTIEVKLQNQLTEARIAFKKHIPIIGQPDIFIEPHDKHYKGVAIFADGDYWHSLPKQIQRDKIVTKELFAQGVYVARFREKEIRDKNFNVVTYIKEIIPLK